ncbi:uncharacterized protein RCO7_14123 [Rhynchosporium graminicola]|uniref:Uncharacterized protein n=1 Tax=Rhynchosporium graminicola TaxID=2792576 RepID=A0A1E1JSK7_9HELO|nr:uncharacterized protein RCO7_14123 [Rhynchosporium commune]
MVRMLCRRKYREGEPLGLTMCPAPTFTSLPLGIRNTIYALLLIKYQFKASLNENCFGQVGILRKIMSPGRNERMVSIEVAAIFYRQNVFSLTGSEDDYLKSPWDFLHSSIYTIGPRNRSYLRHVKVKIARPGSVSVDSDGTVSSIYKGSNWICTVHGRNQHTRIYALVNRQYQGVSLDYVSPGIEAVFRILGPQGSDCDCCYYRSLRICPELHYTLMIPILATFRKLDLESKAALVDTDGWDVLSTQDTVGPVEEFYFDQPARRTICATFRRKWIAGSEALWLIRCAFASISYKGKNMRVLQEPFNRVPITDRQVLGFFWGFDQPVSLIDRAGSQQVTEV